MVQLHGGMGTVLLQDVVVKVLDQVALLVLRLCKWCCKNYGANTACILVMGQRWSALGHLIEEALHCCYSVIFCLRHLIEKTFD